MQTEQQAAVRAPVRVAARPACQLCAEPATADSPWCSDHLADAVERAKTAERVRRLRATRRSARQCIDCGKPSPKHKRCKRCYRRRQSARGVTPGVTPTADLRAPVRLGRATRTVQRAEAGGVRTRFLGRPKGPPTRAEQDEWDLQALRAEVERATQAYVEYHGPATHALPRIQQDAGLSDAVAHLELAVRFAGELIDRASKRLRGAVRR